MTYQAVNSGRLLEVVGVGTKMVEPWPHQTHCNRHRCNIKPTLVHTCCYAFPRSTDELQGLNELPTSHIKVSQENISISKNYFVVCHTTKTNRKSL